MSVFGLKTPMLGPRVKDGSERTGSVGAPRATERHKLVDRHLWADLSVASVLFAGLAFVAALFPGMVPCSDLIQAILNGVAVLCPAWGPLRVVYLQ